RRRSRRLLGGGLGSTGPGPGSGGVLIGHDQGMNPTVALAFGRTEQAAHAGVEVDLGKLAIELVLAARDLDAAAERRDAALRVVDALLAARDLRLVDDGDVAVRLDLLQLALAVGTGDEVAGHKIGAHLPAGLGHDDVAASHHDLALGPVFEAVL